MDPSLLLTALGRDPAVADGQAAHWRGGLLPLSLPAAVLPAATAARWQLANAALPLDRRIETALAAGLEAESWAAVLARPEPLAAHGALDAVLALWARRECQRRLWPTDAPALLVEDGVARAPDTAVLAAISDVQELLPGLGWPRWAGAVVMMTPGAPATAAEEIRPALPVVRLAAGPRRAEAGRALSALALRLAAPPRGGWPPWLLDGVGAVAAARGRSEGPSPAAMQTVRQESGPDACHDLVAGGREDPALAKAVCALLLHARRAARFPRFLAELRRDGDGPRALHEAYGLEARRMGEER